MLDAFKRLIVPADDPFDPKALQAWSRVRRFQSQHDRNTQTTTVQGLYDGQRWVGEFGPAQRSYLGASEWRLRMELGVPGSVQMLLASQGMAREIDLLALQPQGGEDEPHEDDLAALLPDAPAHKPAPPEELQWATLFPRFNLAAVPSLRERYVLMAARLDHARLWLQDDLVTLLEQWQANPATAELPVLLMTLRGRLHLRVATKRCDPAMLQHSVALFEAAARHAVSVPVLAAEEATWPTTTATAWQTQMSPEVPDKRR
jgi:hypothetical protein